MRVAALWAVNVIFAAGLVGVAASTAAMLSGCGLIESAVGVERDPVTGEVRSDGTGGVAGAVANWFLPGVGTLIGAGAAAYANAKRKQWKLAALSTFKGVEEFSETQTGAVVADRLKAKLAEHHTGAKVLTFVDAALDREGINKAAS